MTKLINFSHPLADEAVTKLSKLPYSVHEISDVAVQVDFTQDLNLQVDRIVKEAIEKVGGNPLDIDLVILPGHSTIAVMVTDYLSTYGAHPRIVTMQKNGIASPFLPDKIIFLRTL